MSDLIIYADILFFVNFITDMLCLFVSGRVMNLKIRKLRLCLASAFGGIYGVLSQIMQLWEPICGILVSIIMVLICYDIRSKLLFFKTLLFMYCTGMLSGGIMSFFQRVIYENRHIGLFSEGIDTGLFSVLFAIVFFFITFSSRIFAIYIHKKSVTCIIGYGNEKMKVNLLLDSGNMLKDPFTGKNVAIVKADVLDTLLGKEGIHRGCSLCNSEAVIDTGIHYISAKTVGGQILLPVISSLKIFTCEKKGKAIELFASVASDETGLNDYMGYDGIMPYLHEGVF